MARSKIHRAGALAGAAGALLLAAAGAGAQPGPDRREQQALAPLPLSIAVATVDGERVVDDAWLRERTRWANRIFEPAGLSFARDSVRDLDPEHARLDTRRDRHALGDEMRDDVINVFVVGSLRDVDDPSRFRQGVHWRPAGHPGKHLVILSASAGPTVLAHELGHFFGNRRHPETAGNIMSYNRGDGVPFFDDGQIRRIRRFNRRFLRSGELVAASARSD